MNLHLPSMQLKNFNALSLILAFLMCTGFTFANGYHAASPKPAAAQLQYILDHAADGQMIVLPAVVEEVLTIRSGVSLLTSGTSVVKGIVMDAPGKTAKLLGNLKVEGTLEFKDGILDAGEYILETKEILGADVDSYLVMAVPPPPPGSLTLNVPTSGTVVFPIGTSSGFTPVTVSATAAHTTDLMTVAVADKMNLSDFTAPTPVGPAFAEYEWNVSETVNGGSEVNLKFEFPNDPNNLSNSAAAVGHNIGGSWTNKSTDVSGAGPYTTTNVGPYTSFSPFGVFGMTPVHNLTLGLDYGTIQAAIDAANPNDVILCDAGSYTENINIHKPITLRGPNMGIPGIGVRVAEAILLNCTIDINNAGNTTLDGLHILRNDGAGGPVNQIELDGGGINTVKNCIFERNGSNTGQNIRAIATTTAGGNKVISNNKIFGDASGGLFSGHKSWNSGIYVDQGPFTVSITGNTFLNCRTAMNIDDMNANVTVSGNTLNNNGTHISFGGAASGGSFVLGANDFINNAASTMVNLSGALSTLRIDITSSTLGGVAFGALSNAQLFEVEARMAHKEVTSSKKGKVTYVANTQYVNNFVGKIDVINNSVKYAEVGNIINLQSGTYTQRVVIDKGLTLQGLDSATCILDGTGLGSGSGIAINGGVTNVSIKEMRIQNFTGTSGNSTAAIFATSSNNDLTIHRVTVQNNPSNHGIFGATLSGINNVSITNSRVINHGPGLRGIVLWDGLKTNITISNNLVSNNACCGIELQDGDASGVTVTGNTLDIGGGDNAIGLTGLNFSVGANLVNNNTITGGGRFGIEIKNPSGGVTVSGNNVKLITENTDMRDRAGIAVFRRGVLYNNVDIPNGVVVSGNTVEDYRQSAGNGEEGFGIVIEGTNHTVSGNTVNNCDVAIQQQGGLHPFSNYPGDGSTGTGTMPVLSPNYFGRGNSPYACGNVIDNTNIFSANTVNVRNVISSSNYGLVTNTNNGETFCNIQAAINDAQTINGHTITVAAGTYPENVTVNKSLTINGPNAAISPNSGMRVAEAIIVPATTNTGSGAIVTISVSNVNFKGFKVDGDNPSLPNSGVGLGGVHGLSNDAARGLFINADGVSNISISKNIATKLENGIRIEQTTNYFASGGPAQFSHSILIDDNKVENVRSTGIRLGNSMFAKVTNNTVTNAENGIASSSFRIKDMGNAADRVIANNTISARFAGIWMNLFHTSPYALNNNTITVAPPAPGDANPSYSTRTTWYGILYATVSAPKNFTNQTNLPIVGTPEYWTCNNNTIDGAALEATSIGHGYWLFYVDNNRDGSNIDHYGQISGGTVSNVDVGIFLKNKDTDPASNFGTAAVGAHAGISGVSFTLRTGGTGIKMKDDATWTTINPAPLINKRTVALNLGAGVAISNGAKGILLDYPDSLTVGFVPYDAITGASLNNVAFVGQSGNYIEMLEYNRNLNGISASFDGNTGATATVAQLYSIENKILHNIDDSGLGYVSVKANTTSVTQTSFSNPTTTTPSIQRGINALGSAGRVNIEGGVTAYTGGADATGKTVTLAPGASPSCVTITGNLVLNSGDILDIEADGTTACTLYDQFIVNGTVTLGGATLNLILGYVPANGDQLKIIDNDLADAVTGQFAQGGTILAGGTLFDINYKGGDGNDVVLTACGAGKVHNGANNYCTIQDAIDAASNGDVITVDAGTYAENIVVNKSLTIKGPKFGVDACLGARGTGEAIIMPATGSTATIAGTGSTSISVTAPNVTIDGFTIDGDNSSITNPFTAFGVNPDVDYGIESTQDGLIVKNNIIQNVFQFGVALGSTGGPSKQGVVQNNKIQRIPYWAAILLYDDYYADVQNNCVIDAWRGVQTNNFHLAAPSPGNVKISNNTFTLQKVSIAGDADYEDVSGILINLHYQNASDFEVNNNTITNSSSVADRTGSSGVEFWSIQTAVGVNTSGNVISGFESGYQMWNCPTTNTISVKDGSVTGSDYGVFANNYDGYNSDAASSSYIVDGVDLLNTTTGIYVKDNNSNSNGSTVAVQIKNNALITGSVKGILIEGGDASASFSGATPASFVGQTTYIDQISNGTNAPSTNIDATAVSFDGQTGLTGSFAQLFTIEDKINHKIDWKALGFVLVKANNDYVTDINAGQTAVNNDYTRLRNAVEQASNNWTINLKGSFNWVETNAANSWALGNDGVVSPSDDYSILIPANINGVTFTAPEGLSTASINGPGDLPAVNLEGVLVFDGGDNQNWTISNMEFKEFDLSIGMFNGAGGSDAFNNTTITNNTFNIATDLNAVVAPADVSQNIGLHYSFGTNQTISNNTFNIPGDGVSNGANFSSTVAMQSNTSGGAVYNGLSISGNTINILNAQSANPQVVLGIWENAHGHSSTINVTNNQFLNLAGGNNPVLNLQRGFRVTSHSSAGTTVTYSGNTAKGANIGFQWLAGQNFAGNLPIQLTSNILNGNDIGVLVQSNGKALLTTNDFDDAIDNNKDVQIQAGSIVTTGNGNQFAGDNYYIENLSSTGINITGDLFDETNNFRRTDRIYGALDNATSGLIRFNGSNLYVSTPGTGSSDETIPNAIAAAAASGDFINIETGTYASGADATSKEVTFAPGSSPGCVTLSGNMVLTSGDALAMEINGTTVCTLYDKFIVLGTVTLGGSNLAITLGFAPASGDQFTIIENDGVDAVTGQFAQGGTILVGATLFDINYQGGDGNDVVLTACGAGKVHNGANNYCTIQDAIDAASPGDLITVDPGTYPENVTVNKTLTINGPKLNLDADTRFAAFTGGPSNPKADPTVEAIITTPANNPLGGNPGANDLIRILANGVTINGFVIDGNNPTLPPSSVTDGGSVNIHARRGITNRNNSDVAVPLNNLNIKYNIIQNLAQRVINLANDGPVSTGNLITENVLRHYGYDPVNGGQAVILFTNAYADITNNTIEISDNNIGLHLQNFSNNGNMSWSNNNVTVGQDAIGMHANLFYAPSASLTINNNTVNAATGVTGTSDYTWGINIWSVQVGSTVSLTGNTVGSSGGVFGRGINLWNLPTSNTVTVNGGTVGKSAIGINLDNVDPYFGAGSNTQVNVSNVTVNSGIGQNGIQARTDVINAVPPAGNVTLNLDKVTVNGGTNAVAVMAPASSSPFTASLTIDNDSELNKTGGQVGTGVLVSGTQASANIKNNDASINGYAIGIDVDGGSALIENNHIYDNGIGVRFINSGTGTVKTNKFFETGLPNGKDLQLAASAGAVTATANNWFAGSTYGVENLSATDVDATLNYWNAANGPGPVGPGSGANITTKVLYCQYLNGIPVPLGGTGVATSPTVTIAVTETSGVANNDGIICAGASATLDATTTGATAYSWSTGATTASIIVSPGSTTTYTVTVTFPGCTVTDDQMITVEPLPACTITGTNGPVCPNTSNDFSGPAGVSYAWSISGNATIPGATNAQTVSVLAGSLCNNNFTLTLVTTDGNSCTSSCTKTVNVLDNAGPVITPGTIAACYPTVAAAEAAALAATSATDNCPGSITEAASTSGTCSAVVTVTETDACGNVSSTAYNTRIDNAPPTFTSCPTTITVNNVVGLCGRSVSYAAPTATDNCTGMLTILKVDGTGLMSGDFFPVGTTLQKFETTDECGNTSTCMFNVVVIDNELPIITGCPTNIVKSTDPGLCTALVTWVAPTASDNCPGVSLSLSPNLPPGSIFPKGTTNMTYTATDVSGNIAVCNFSVTVNDNELPQITCPANIVVNADAGQCSAVVTYTTPVGTDNCPSPMTTQTTGLPSGAAFPVGLTTNTFKVTDGSTNMATCSFTVTVNDNQNPVITDCPDDITVSCAADSTIANTGGPAIATDNCPGVIVSVMSEVVTNKTCDHRFTLTRTWKATDATGNTTTCTQVVTVNDVTAPSLTGIPYAGTTGTNACLANAATAAPFSATNAILGYTDNCTGALTATLTNTNVTGTDCGWTVTYTFTVKDVCGNELTGRTYSNTGSDQTAPSLTGMPHTGSSGTNACKANAATAAPFNATEAIEGYTDNCGGAVTATLTNTVVTGTDCAWTVTYTFTISDVCGNELPGLTYSNTGSDQTPPAITCASGSPFTRGTTLGYCGYIVSGTEFNATASDLCGGAVTITNNFNLTNTLANDTLPTGTTTIVWTATDACGNSSSCTIMVTVTDGENPQVFCKVGKGLDFDGVNEYVTVADNAVLEGMGALTVMGWMKIDALPVQNYAPIAKENAYRLIVGANGSFHFVVATTSNGWYSAGTVGSGGSNLLPTNKWIHVAGVYTGSKVNVYVNGVLMGTSTGTISGNIINNGSPLTMAFKTSSNIDYFNGKMDEVGVFNQALTASQIKAYLGTSLLGTEPGLVAYYNLEQGTGTVANDNAGSAQNGTLVNMENVDWIRTPFGPNNSITVNTDPGVCKAALIFDVATIDNCGIISNLNDFNNTSNASGDYLKGTTVVTWTATDAVPNTGTCSFTVIVNDSIKPTISCPLNQTKNTDLGECNYTVVGTEFDPTAFDDNCPGETISNNYDMTSSLSGSDFPTGLTTVIWTVTDASGNTMTCSFTVTVNDNQAPTVSCVAPQTRGTDAPACTYTAVGTEFDPTGSNDNCAVTSTTYSLSGVTMGSGSNTLAGVVFNKGVTTVTWTVLDAAGNMGSCSFTVTVNDDDAPTPVCNNISVNLNSSGNYTLTTANINAIAAGTVDNCTPYNLLTLAVLPNSFNCSNVGPNTVTLTVTDDASPANSATCNAIVTVVDITPPVITCPPNVTLNAVSGSCEQTHSWTVPVPTDACGIMSLVVSTSNNTVNVITIGTTAFALFPVGTTTVTYTATDVNGNTAACSFTVTIVDNQPPIISNCPTNIGPLGNDPGLCGRTVSWNEPTASDNCPGVMLTTTPPNANGSFFPVGVPTLVTYKATDAGGLMTTCSFTVTIIDSEAPQITCPANITASNDAGMCSAVVNYTAPVGTDNCPGSVTVKLSGLASGSSFPVGVSTIVYKVTDVPGAMATCSFTVTVNDTELPVISCPSNISVPNDANLCSAVVNYTAPVGTDNCPGANTIQTAGLASGAAFPVGVTTNTFKVTDASGNTATCSFTVTVTDAQAPQITCPSPIVKSNDPGLCSALVTYTAPTGTDNCSGANTIQTAGQASGSYFPVGVTTNTFKVTDAGGLTATCSFTVTVNDTEAPQISCPNNITVSTDAGLCTAVVNYTTPVGTDNCPGVTTARIAGLASGAAFPKGTTNVTYEATDAGGVKASCTFIVTVNDNELPQITCPANIVVSNTTGQCAAVVIYTAPVGTDNCAGANTIQTAGLASGASFPVGVTTNTFKVTDAMGNTATCSFTVTVNDTELPLITCLSNISVPNDMNLCSAVVTYTAPVGTDNCPGPNTVQIAGLASGAAFPVGVTTNTFKVTDASGNTATCSFTVTVNDTQLPVISCPANISKNNDPGLCAALVNYTAPTGTDNCPGANTIQTAGLASASYFPVGVTTNTFKVTDASGNMATCSFTVTVTDTEVPQIVCPGNIIIANDNGNCSAIVNYTAPVGTDNCPGANTVQTAGLPSGSAFPVGVTVNTFKVTDGASNTATCSFTITVNDEEAPQINCPANIVTTNTPGLCSKVVTYTTPVGTDNCPGANTTQTAGLPSGAAFPVGVTTNTFKVEDAEGNIATCSFTVTVNDTEAPQITCPTNIVVGNNPGLCSALVTYTAPVGTDNCPGANTIQTAGLASGSYFPVGTTTNTFKVTDAAGNTMTCSFTVTVNDTELPQISCPNNITVSTDAGLCTAVVNYATPVGTDNCPGANTIQTAGLASGAAFPKGTTTNTFKVTDATGNMMVCSFTVTVNDNELPQITCPANIITNTTPGLCTAVVNYTAPSGTDNCPGANTIQTAGLASGAIFPKGVTTNTFKVTDAMGNTATCSFTVTVNDNELPQITCPANVVVSNDAGYCSAEVNYTPPTGSDNCPGQNTVQTSGLGSGSAFPVGVTTNTFKVTDASGNTATCSFTVTVNDTEDPQIVCPANIVEDSDPGICSALVTYTAPIGTDNCPNPNTVQTAGQPSGTYFPVGVTTNTFEVTDASGNAASCSFTITVNDIEDPIILNCPETRAIEGCNTGAITSPAYSATLATTTYAIFSGAPNNGDAIENCGITLVQYQDVASGTCPITVTRTWTISDAAGNSDVCVQTITIDDTQNPVINACAVTRNIEGCNTGAISGPAYSATEANSSEAEFENGTNQGDAGDVCGIASVKYQDSQSGTCPIVVTRTWTITDACGNQTTCTQTINVDDTQAPTITVCPATRTIEGCGLGSIDNPPFSMTWAASTYSVYSSAPNNGAATDVCGIVTVEYKDVASGECPVVVTRTWRLTDACGNSSTCNQTISVDDTQAPSISVCPVTRNINGCSTADITGPVYSATTKVSSYAVFSDVTNQGAATDACSINAVTYKDVASGTCPIVVTRTWTVSDVCGNSTTCNQIINVLDVTAPDIEDCAEARDISGCTTADITDPPYSAVRTASTEAVFESSPNWGNVSDTCGIVTVEYKDVAVGSCPMTVTRTWYFKDACGNESSCNQIITVDDNINPTPTCPANITQPNATGVCGATVTFNGSATDNCSGMPVITYSKNSGTFFNVGTTTVTMTATDGCGNSATCTFTVTVNDTTKPTVITKPVTLYLNALGTATLLTANVNNGSFDNCAITSLTLSKTSFNCSNIGPNVVTLTAKDAANNMGSNTAVVTILDTIKPNVTCKNITVDLVGGTKTITPIQVRLTATDNCGTPNLSINKSTFTCADPINNNVVLTATDASGNSKTCTSVVTIRY
ncbi:MAG: HYR domain-containing protein, partial [Saprospiraceae bacterium]|nr:HYR domain-containing protein [Saprospiraceae bacterium]